MAYDVAEAKQLVIRAGKELVKSGLIARTWGNISARISENEFVITPSGRSYEGLTPEDIVAVGLDGSFSGEIKPSSEKGVHAAIYELRPAVNFVIHTHQTNASALGVLGGDVTDIVSYGRDVSAILGETVPTADYGRNASERLKRNVAAAVASQPGCTAALMRYHGAVCFGASYEDAFRSAYLLEEVCGKRYEERTGEALLLPEDPRRFYRFVPEDHLEEYRRAFSDPTIGAVIRTSTPYVRKMSMFDRTMRPYLDDLAQIAGVTIRTVSPEAKKKEVAFAMRGRTAVLVEGKGAICVGADASEAEAVCQVLEKGCQAAYLAHMVGRIPPLSHRNSYHDRSVYVRSYSRLKER